MSDDLILAAVTAATGFLIAVLWFDLMFDVQVLRHRATEVPKDTVASIAAYYRRVTTEASPMGRLVGAVMAVLLAALALQAIDGEVGVWVSAVSLGLAILAIGLAGTRILRRAVRLGSEADDLETQGTLARGILRDHLICLAAMAGLLAVQLVSA